MSMTIKEIKVARSTLEKEVNALITKFEKTSEMKVDYISRRTSDYKNGKDVKLKNPVVRIDVNIDNDPRSL